MQENPVEVGFHPGLRSGVYSAPQTPSWLRRGSLPPRSRTPFPALGLSGLTLCATAPLYVRWVSKTCPSFIGSSLIKRYPIDFNNFFGRNIPEIHVYWLEAVVSFPTSPDRCSYTTWGV